MTKPSCLFFIVIKRIASGLFQWGHWLPSGKFVDFPSRTQRLYQGTSNDRRRRITLDGRIFYFVYIYIFLRTNNVENCNVRYIYDALKMVPTPFARFRSNVRCNIKSVVIES